MASGTAWTAARHLFPTAFSPFDKVQPTDPRNSMRLHGGDLQSGCTYLSLPQDGLFQLSDEDNATICMLTEGYSGSDMKNLVKDASMGPLREALRLGIEITKLKKEDMRPVTLQDFENALQEVRPSVSFNELGTYEDWNRQFGSLSM